ncbi:MAG: RNA 2'-phosphotransferase [Clostridia bacterium]|nr:RNA 2'-phosphotransferase [Clostridia bacterium]
MKKEKDISVYLSFLLRHKPDDIGLMMDTHGWILVEELLNGINQSGKYTITRVGLEEIVAKDNKGRYRFNEDGTKIKACQGHSIPWVEPELRYSVPPEYLYHGTTAFAYEKIKNAGYISKMNRHAVHMTADESKAWQSATRWHTSYPIVLKINAEKMANDGYMFGVSENEVWCISDVPLRYISQVLTEKREET